MNSDLQLFKVNLDVSPIEIDHLWQVLSEDERSRADRFKFAHLRRNFVAARANLRLILSQFLNCKATDIEFAYGDRGKPYLKNQPIDIHFNLAHAQNLAAYAVCCNRQVGIDLEYMNLDVDVEGIAQRYFSKKEQVLIQSLSINPQQQYFAFYRAWVLKEAYAKATGLGIANLLHLDCVSLLENPDGEALTINRWMLQLITDQLDLSSKYVAALCTQK
ncbi:MAG: hypothetical protein AUK48_05115 [Oscillatoriales cyanobacterium CG2_30_44_21]|nr:MAG: hypothetical protein AUK48_05115 [Oscillatoriales cyanobacterium CG2_30_44_21]